MEGNLIAVHLLTATAALLFFLAIVIGLVLMSHIRSRLNQSFAFLMFAVGIWALFQLFAALALTAQIPVVKHFLSSSLAVIPVIGATLIHFIAAYQIEHQRDTRAAQVSRRVADITAIGLVAAVAASITVGEPGALVMGHGSPLIGDVVTLTLLAVYMLAASTYAVWGLLGIAHLADSSDSLQTKRDVQLLLPSLIFGLASVGAIYLQWLGYPIPSITPLLGALILTLGTTYPIARRQVFSGYIVATELMMFLVWIILFIQLIRSASWPSFLFNALLLVTIILVGLMLVRTASNEARQRRQLDSVSRSLQELNRNLEEKVSERTSSIAVMLQHTNRLIENLTVGLLEFDNDFRLIRCNRAAERILGINKSLYLNTIIEPRAVDVSETESLAKVTYPFLAPSATHVENPDDPDVEVHELILTYPEERDVQLVTLPFVTHDQEGDLGIVKIIRDTSREKQIDRNKSEFISIAAHKLRTPLSGIKWALRFILDGDAGEISPKQQEYLTKSYDTNERLIQIVNDLLDVARIEKGALTFKYSRSDLISLVDSTVHDLRPEAEEKRLIINFTTPDNETPQIDCDVQKIRIAFTHVLSNAIHYTPPGGSINVAIHPPVEGSVVIEIEDSGIGIPRKDIERLFSKFYRSEAAAYMYTEGSGLGLLITKSVIEGHGGRLAISPRQPEGTVVRITLPLIHEGPR
jgi:signal transduction histidine kinase